MWSTPEITYYSKLDGSHHGVERTQTAGIRCDHGIAFDDENARPVPYS